MNKSVTTGDTKSDDTSRRQSRENTKKNKRKKRKRISVSFLSRWIESWAISKRSRLILMNLHIVIFVCVAAIRCVRTLWHRHKIYLCPRTVFNGSFRLFWFGRSRHCCRWCGKENECIAMKPIYFLGSFFFLANILLSMRFSPKNKRKEKRRGGSKMKWQCRLAANRRARNDRQTVPLEKVIQPKTNCISYAKAFFRSFSRGRSHSIAWNGERV